MYKQITSLLLSGTFGSARYAGRASLSLGLLLSLNAFGISWQRQDVTQPLAKKPTTVLVYIAGDNNLSPYINLDLKEMEKIGSNANLNILAYVSSADSLSKWTRALVVQKGQTFQDGADMNKDSGKAQTAIDAVNWAHTKFPSDNLVIIFWNHGSGPTNRNGLTSTFFGAPWGTPSDRAFCYDDTTNSYFTDQDLRAVLSYANTLRGKQVDIVAFDACLMATVEVAYAAQPYAKYLVASEETIPGEGYPYHTALSVASESNATPARIVADMVKDYGAIYSSMRDYTLSGTDLSKIPVLRAALDSLATVLITFMGSSDKATIKQVIRTSSNASKCTYFTETAYIDLGHFLSNLQANVRKAKINNKTLLNQLNTALAQSAAALKNCIVAQVKGSQFPKATGLSVYMERYSSLDPYYASTQWAKDTKWAQMLRKYIAS